MYTSHPFSYLFSFPEVHIPNYYHNKSNQRNKNAMSAPTSIDLAVPLSQNNMDTPEHKTLYERGLAMRKLVVGEDYVANSLEKGSSDFMRPLQQLATVLPISTPSPPCPSYSLVF
jgi:4-carboxymuconolactone decarboxylase